MRRASGLETARIAAGAADAGFHAEGAERPSQAGRQCADAFGKPIGNVTKCRAPVLCCVQSFGRNVSSSCKADSLMREADRHTAPDIAPAPHGYRNG
jgi:hypothetical protein